METETARQTIKEFCKAEGIRLFAVTRVDSNPNMDSGDREMDHWKVTLEHGASRYDSKKLVTYFSMGKGHKGRKPNVTEILDCLASDASGYLNARYFEDWAEEYGYDVDSRKAEASYRIVGEQTKKLERFMGAAFETLLYSVDRE